MEYLYNLDKINLIRDGLANNFSDYKFKKYIRIFMLGLDVSNVNITGFSAM
jgi:hypothetical protein